MKLVFIYGPPASGKYTVARKVSERSRLPLFHNHLIVDAVGAVFPFGSEHFMRLREKFWFETFEAAVETGTSLIFTFMPEASVTPDFAEKVCDLVRAHGGDVVRVRLDLSRQGQLDRIANKDRGQFGKLQDANILEANFDQFERRVAAMPEPDLAIDTDQTSPDDSADKILALIA